MRNELLWLYEGQTEYWSIVLAARAALQKAHDELERKVEERTADLSAANQQLQGEVAESEVLRLMQALLDAKALARALTTTRKAEHVESLVSVLVGVNVAARRDGEVRADLDDRVHAGSAV